MGRTIMEGDLKSYLQECNPEIHFDMGTCLNIWHPYQDKRQGVFFRGQHICSMDRGMISENPIWAVEKKHVTLPAGECSWSELTDPMTMIEFFDDGEGNQTPTGNYIVERKVRGKKLYVGWRHTLRRILGKNIPGVDQGDLERRFGIDLSFQTAEELENRGNEMSEAEAEKSRIVVASR